MSTVVGFTVACSSPSSPGEDAVGNFTFRVSLNYGTDETVYVDIPVKGKPNGTAPPGDDTKQVAESAAKAINASKGLTSGQKANISVQTDQGGPGNTLGRIVIDDPDLKKVDAACDDKGKVQLSLIFTGGGTAPGGVSSGPKSPGGRNWRTVRNKTKKEDPPKRPRTGNKYQWYLDPGRSWADAMVLVGVKGAVGTTGVGVMLPYLEGLVGESVLWLPMVSRVLVGSPEGQAFAIATAMSTCGIACDVHGSAVKVMGFLGSPEAVICGVGYQSSVVGGVGRNPWEVAVGTDVNGNYEIIVLPSTLDSFKPPMARQVGLESVLEMGGVRPMPTVHAGTANVVRPASGLTGERRAAGVVEGAEEAPANMISPRN